MKLKQIESNIKDNLDYQTKQKHSDVVDDYYGFSVYDIESSLVDNAQVKFPNGNYKSWGKSLYAGSEADVVKGAGLLFVYSLGIGIPFLLAASVIAERMRL